jgi:hypothetical protein
VRHYLLLARYHELARVELLPVEVQETLQCAGFGELGVSAEVLLVVLVQIGQDQNYQTVRIQAT